MHSKLEIKGIKACLLLVPVRHFFELQQNLIAFTCKPRENLPNQTNE
jgi:hypothetical protein